MIISNSLFQIAILKPMLPAGTIPTVSTVQPKSSALGTAGAGPIAKTSAFRNPNMLTSQSSKPRKKATVYEPIQT